MLGILYPRRCLASLITAVIVAIPGSATAGEYTVDFCKDWVSDAPGNVLPGVIGFGASGEVTDCHRGATDGGIHQLHVGARMAHDTVAGIRLTVPADRPGITIDRVLTAHSLAASSGGLAFLRFMAGGAVLDNEAGAQSRRDDRPLPAGVRGLEWSVYCSFSAGPVPCQWSSADDVMHVYKVRLFLIETDSPSLAITGGTLLDGGRGARTGAQTITFDSEDVDSGLESVSALLGGVAAGRIRYPCPGRDWSVCQRARRGQTLTVDTTAVPDGTHALTLVATDAAGNATIRSAGEVDIRDGSIASTTAPPDVVVGPEIGNSSDGGTPNGSPASRGAKLSLTRTGVHDAQGRIRSRYESELIIRGRLVDRAAGPIADATVDVLSRQQRAGASRTHTGTASTDRNGEFSYRLSSGPSRTVTFAYTAFAGEQQSAVASVSTSVPASIVGAQFSPQSPRPAQRVSFTGRLKYLARSGIQIGIQFRDGRRWRTIGLTHTRAQGRFTWYYRFVRAFPGDRFMFRAHVSSPIYPFAAGNSRAVTVTLSE